MIADYFVPKPPWDDNELKQPLRYPHNMARTKFTPGTKFYVKTTNDESLSNSKCTFILPEDKVQIAATKIINTGDEIKLLSERPYYLSYSIEDDYPSHLMKQSTEAIHKRKLSDTLGEDYGNEDPIMDYKRQTLKFKIEMAKREIYLWEQQICEINREINATKKNSTGNEGRCGVDNSDSDMDVKKTNT